MPEGKDSPEPKPIAAGLAFNGLVQTRNTEATLRWLGFQFALGANIAGLSAIGIWLLQEPTKQEFIVMFVACLSALTGNRTYFSVLARDGKFMGLWNDKMIQLERANGIEGGVKIFSSQQYLELKSRKPTIQQVLRRSVLIISMIWVVFAAGILLNLAPWSW